MDEYDNEMEDVTPGLNDEYSGKDQEQEAMSKEDFHAWIECQKVDEHLKGCDKHKTQ